MNEISTQFDYFYFGLPIAVLLVSIGTMYLVRHLIPLIKTHNHYSNLDGLRGILALLVFVHHSYSWKTFVISKLFDSPTKMSYMGNFGSVPVAVFFMLTGFLFFSKIFCSNKEINWRQLYIGRFFRIVPLYYVLGILTIITLLLNFGNINSLLSKQFYVSLLTWILGGLVQEQPPVAYDHMRAFTGVTWTLHFEWLFYVSLPILSLLIFKNRNKKTYITSLVSIILIIVLFQLNAYAKKPFLNFLGGFIGFLVVKYSNTINKKLFKSFISEILTILLFIVIMLFKFPFYVSFILTTAFFCLILLGNSFFGFLNLPLLRKLGEISYGIYLLHGFIIFSIFEVILSNEATHIISNNQYYLIIAFSIITVLVIVFCSACYAYIEKYFISLGKKISGK